MTHSPADHDDHLPDPAGMNMKQALATAGCVMHHVASDPARLQALAADMEHCPGDLPPAFLLAWLDAAHAHLEPGCAPVQMSLQAMRAMMGDPR